jgi:hypothetical protein
MKKSIHSEKRKGLVWLCIVGLWTFFAFSFWAFYYGKNGRLNESWRTSVPMDNSGLLRAVENMKVNNETGSFSVFKWEDTHARRPEYAIQCQNLTGQKGRLGIFKTAAYKQALIEGLEVRLYSYSDQIKDGDSSGAGLFTDLLARQGFAGGSEDVHANMAARADLLLLDIEKQFDDATQKLSLGIDLSNVTAIIVRDFKGTLYDDSHPCFLLSCSKVQYAGRSDEIEFQGRVLIRARDGSELRSNHVVWRLEESCFWVPGRYALIRDGKVVTAQGFRCDEQLRIISVVEE